mmetsp:Transcript_25542/g.73862  ORF Transcript_25542/g.73862 Transcript_25542/m.73862 type:complete len:215 (-) Transcript_25542:91-735(-)
MVHVCRTTTGPEDTPTESSPIAAFVIEAVYGHSPLRPNVLLTQISVAVTALFCCTVPKFIGCDEPITSASFAKTIPVVGVFGQVSRAAVQPPNRSVLSFRIATNPDSIRNASLLFILGIQTHALVLAFELSMTSNTLAAASCPSAMSSAQMEDDGKRSSHCSRRDRRVNGLRLPMANEEQCRATTNRERRTPRAERSCHMTVGEVKWKAAYDTT